MTEEFDVFISHASEDKASVARPLAEKLARFDLNVWFDEFTLKVGDSLIESIDRGLTSSRFGVVILSRSFLRKGWAKYELRGLVTREIGEGNAVLPIWHDINKQEIEELSPTLADKFALDTSKQELDEIVLLLIRAIRPDIYENLTRYVAWINLKRKAQVRYRPLSELKPGPIRHNSLPDKLLIRVKIVHWILKEVLHRPLPRFIQSFQRDMNPQNELTIWERIATTYVDLTSDQELSLDEKQRIFGDLLGISMQPKERVQEMLESNDQSRVSLVDAYLGAAPQVPSDTDES